MGIFLDVFSWIFILLGGAFLIIGAIGVIRLPDVYTRSHAAGMVDTFGAGMVLLGLMLQSGGFNLILVKLIFIGGFLFFTSPPSCYAVVRAALDDGVKPILDENADLGIAATDKGERSS